MHEFKVIEIISETQIKVEDVNTNEEFVFNKTKHFDPGKYKLEDEFEDTCDEDSCQVCCEHGDMDDHCCLDCGAERDYGAEADYLVDQYKDGVF